MTDPNDNENVHGEGNYEASRKYLESQKEFQKTHDVDELAKKAKEAVENDDGELEKAEEAGKAKKKT